MIQSIVDVILPPSPVRIQGATNVLPGTPVRLSKKQEESFLSFMAHGRHLPTRAALSCYISCPAGQPEVNQALGANLHQLRFNGDEFYFTGSKSDMDFCCEIIRTHIEF